MIIKKPSLMGTEQFLLLKKGTSKKPYKEFCRKCRNSLMPDRNYGTKRTASVRDYDWKKRSICFDELEFITRGRYAYIHRKAAEILAKYEN